MKSLAIFVALVPLTTFAGGHKPKPQPGPVDPISLEAESYALAGADADASSTSDSKSIAFGGRSGDSSATGGTSVSRGGRSSSESSAVSGDSASSGVGEVSVGGDSQRYESKALALSIPGLVAAPAVPGDCRIHTRGWGIASGGATGGTKFDAERCARIDCLARADRYATWGRIDLAVKQLESCGGVKDETPPAPPVDTASKAYVNEVVKRALVEKVSK